MSQHDSDAFQLGVMIGLTEFQASTSDTHAVPLVTSGLDATVSLANSLKQTVPGLAAAQPQLDDARVAINSSGDMLNWRNKLEKLRGRYGEIISATGSQRLSSIFSLGVMMAFAEGQTSRDDNPAAIELALDALRNAQNLVPSVNQMANVHLDPTEISTSTGLLNKHTPVAQVAPRIQHLRVTYGEQLKTAPLGA